MLRLIGRIFFSRKDTLHRGGHSIQTFPDHKPSLGAQGPGTHGTIEYAPPHWEDILFEEGHYTPRKTLYTDLP